MNDCNAVTTLMNADEKLSKDMCPKNEDEKKEIEKLPYQNLIGCLLYLAGSTRPDIAYTVSVLSQFNTNFGIKHWIAAKRVLRYLKGTQNLGLLFKKNGKNLTGYAVADWGASIGDRRSYTGFIFSYGSTAISWESRKQRTVAMSSTEAEYMAISESAKEAIYLRRFLDEILDSQGPTTIFNDNQSAGRLCRNPIFHNRTKHIDLRYHFIREAIERGDIQIDYKETSQMPADILTKAISYPKHKHCIEMIALQKS
ncbi:secreted RxLR effector protein 161-like [Rhagoletis pomonella]|uniref:secreted RxLR effector protein 161-like n=1 Tax=Rhagoletis pomonella TaxID=28610 RepID=UPI001784CA4C|nr:secreted RxLR effector protein 161-like [Rhagoletis pomonella]